MQLLRRLGHDRTFKQPIVWITTLVFGAFHAGSFAALFFSWKALAVAWVLWWIVGGVGIGMGYHRLLTHRGYKRRSGWSTFLPFAVPWRWKAARSWVGVHRMHHQSTDR